MQSIFMLDINQLHHHPQNPRKEIGDIEELTESVRKKGILQNLTVVERPGCYDEDNPQGYYVVIGNRRLEAAKAAGLIQLPCVIARMTEKEQLETMLMENMQRADLTIKEQADGFQMMIDLGSDVDDISAKTGFAKSTIYHRLNIAKLDGDILQKKQVTMQELIQLEKVKDIDRRNWILNAYGGTQSFDYAVRREVEEEETRERMAKVIELVEKAGIPKSKEYASIYERGIETVQCFYCGNEKDVPTSIEEIKHGEFYIADSSKVTICIKAEPIPQEEIEKEKKREERNRRDKELQEISGRINNKAANAIIEIVESEKNVLKLTDDERKTLVMFAAGKAVPINTAAKTALQDDDIITASDTQEELIAKVEVKPADEILLFCCLGHYNAVFHPCDYAGHHTATDIQMEMCEILKMKGGLVLTEEEEEVFNGLSDLYVKEE